MKNAAELSSELNTSRKIHVLLVDDQAMIAEGIRRMLEPESDMEFHYCNDPAQAIAKAIDIEATIVLQDLVMPDIDGMTLVRFFRANHLTKDIPVIVLSSKEDPAVKSEAFANGANDYLVKLPDRIELIARIRAHTRHYLMQMERDAAFFALREMQKQLERSNAELHRISSLDGLTGIANRRHFDTKLEEEWQRAMREKECLALALIDIDFFKDYNDSYGHQAGDDCLKQVAEALSQCLSRPADLIARYGGEEFAAILPATNAEGAATLAEKFRTAVARLAIEHRASECADTVTISAGVVAVVPDRDLDANALIKLADEALYQAKAEGRDRTVIS